jgi:hypothetical protein
LPLPEGVREAIGRRLAPLTPEARDVLAVGAVIGAQFRVATLARAAGMPRDDVLPLLDSAVEHGLLHAVTGSAESYSFSHGLVQATVYDGLAPSRRAELHGAVGEAIEDVYDPDERETRLTELAHHFLESAQDANAEKAVAYARRAGDRAMSQFAYDQAATLFERALAVPGPHPRTSGPPCSRPSARRRRAPAIPRPLGARWSGRAVWRAATTTPTASPGPPSRAGSGGSPLVSTTSSCASSRRRSSAGRPRRTACWRA